MAPRLLLDTHILVRSLGIIRKLSREQIRELNVATRRNEPMAFSAASLVELAMLVGDGKLRLGSTLDEFFGLLQENPAFQLLPLTYEIASEAAALGSLRDPADRVIVATARVHRLRLLTSDQRILDSRLVAVIG